MTVDTRYPNSQLVAIAGCLPILEAILATAGYHFVVGDALVQWYSRFGMLECM